MSASLPSPPRNHQAFANGLKFPFNARSAGNRQPFPSIHRKAALSSAAPAFSPDARIAQALKELRNADFGLRIEERVL